MQKRPLAKISILHDQSPEGRTRKDEVFMIMVIYTWDIRYIILKKTKQNKTVSPEPVTSVLKRLRQEDLKLKANQKFKKLGGTDGDLLPN